MMFSGVDVGLGGDCWTWVFCPLNLINAHFSGVIFLGLKGSGLHEIRGHWGPEKHLSEQWLVAALPVPPLFWLLARGFCCCVSLWHSISLCEYLRIWTIWLTKLPSRLWAGTGEYLVSTISTCQASQSGASVSLCCIKTPFKTSSLGHSKFWLSLSCVGQWMDT